MSSSADTAVTSMMSRVGGWPMGDIESSRLPTDGVSHLASNLVNFVGLLLVKDEPDVDLLCLCLVEDEPEMIKTGVLCIINSELQNCLLNYYLTMEACIVNIPVWSTLKLQHPRGGTMVHLITIKYQGCIGLVTVNVL